MKKSGNCLEEVVLKVMFAIFTFVAINKFCVGVIRLLCEEFLRTNEWYMAAGSVFAIIVVALFFAASNYYSIRFVLKTIVGIILGLEKCFKRRAKYNAAMKAKKKAIASKKQRVQ